MGIITRGDIVRALGRDPSGRATALEAGSTRLLLAHPDDLLDDAVTTMLRENVGRLLVVTREEPTRLVGYLGRATILAARRRNFDEEHLREPGWLQSAPGEQPQLPI